MHDYVVIGAGSAGCVIARRLSDDPKCKVLLVEAGAPKHKSLLVRAPAAYQLLWRSKLDWNLYTTPQKHVDDRRMYWPRGKVLGGTSCLNAMVYIRGHRDNYDEWRDLGNPGWGYDDVLPYFKRSQNHARGASDHHGGDGPLRVSKGETLNAVSQAFIDATAKVCGVRVTDDFNGAEQEGVGPYHHTTHDDARHDVASAFVDPVRDRENLTVVTGALALGLVIDGGRARGVRCLVRGREETFSASKEVIVCGGAIGSPHLLLLSGIGPADELRALGVPVIADVPGVGKNLQDHLLAVVSYETESPAVLPQTTLRSLVWLAKYFTSRGGPLRVSPVEAGAFVRSRPEEPRPDVQYHFAPWGTPEPNTDEHHPPPSGRLFSIYPGLIYPRSVGELRLTSKDPRELPAIDPRYFSDDADLAHLVRGVRQSREIAATAPLASFVKRERTPGAEHESDDAIRASIRKSVNTIFHPVGTCKMGNDAMAVVDAELRVRGVEGLRVADASIMPKIIGGNTNAPVIMIAEKAADLLRGSA